MEKKEKPKKTDISAVETKTATIVVQLEYILLDHASSACPKRLRLP